MSPWVFGILGAAGSGAATPPPTQQYWVASAERPAPLLAGGYPDGQGGWTNYVDLSTVGSPNETATIDGGVHIRMAQLSVGDYFTGEYTYSGLFTAWNSDGTADSYILDNNKMPNAVAKAPSGGFYAGISSVDYSPINFQVAKFSSLNTAPEWQSEIDFTADRAGLAADSSGNIYIVSPENSSGTFIRLLKISPAGILQWQKTFTVPDAYVQRFDFKIDSSNNLVILFGGDSNYLIKVDSAGNIQWTRTIAIDQYQYSRSIAIDSSDNVYLVSGTIHLILTKISSSGTLLWAKQFGNPDFSTYYFTLASVKEDSSGGVLISSAKSTSTGEDFVTLIKVNSNGEIDWQTDYSLVSNSYAFMSNQSISSTSDDFSFYVNFAPQTNIGYLPHTLKVPKGYALSGTYTPSNTAGYESFAFFTSNLSVSSYSASVTSAANPTLSNSSFSVSSATATVLTVLEGASIRTLFA